MTPPGPLEPLVVAVAADGKRRGPVSRRHAHEADGVLHLAVSVQLVDRRGLWLLQRRTVTKPLFANRWANSCCTHPRPGEPPEAAAARAVGEELGLAVPLRPAGVFTYRAIDPSSGLIEHEQDVVFVGVTESSATVADARHVGALAWVSFEQAATIVDSVNGAPWAGTVLRMALEALAAPAGLCQQQRRSEA